MSTTEQTIPAGSDVTVAAKNQRKALKALKGTGIKKVDGISRVVIRKRMGVVFVIETPEVYRTPNGSYIVLGAATEQKQDYQQQLQQLAQRQPGAGEADKSPEAIQADLAANVDKLNVQSEEEPDVPDSEVNMDGLEADSVEMIREQANVSKAKAVRALRANNGDVVNALLSFSA